MSEILKFTIVIVWMLLTTIIIMSVLGGLIMHVTGFTQIWGKIPDELYPELFKRETQENRNHHNSVNN
jgi:hypothetical protein